MKTLIKSMLVVAGLSLTFAASAAKTDSTYLAECKSSVNAQFDSVTKIDVASINSRRNLFKAKLRVKAGGQRSMVLCEIRNEEALALTCVKGKGCDASSIAAN